MEKDVLQFKCYHHEKEVVAFDLDPLAERKDKLLCQMCLVVQSPYKQIKTIQDAQQKFMEMRKLEFTDKENQSTSNLEKLSYIQKQIYEFHDFFLNQITESQKILDSRIQEEQNELKNLIEPQQGMQTEKDLLDLINYVNYGIINYNNEISPQQLEFINQIQKQLDYQIFEKHLWKISNSLYSIYTQSLTKQQKQLIPSEVQKIDENKFTNLRYLCEIHKSNITMISLEPGQIEQRLFCNICAQGKKLDGLNSLFEVNNKWQIYLQKVYRSNINLDNQRLNNQLKINDLVSIYQKLQQEIFKELSQLLIHQNNRIIEDRYKSLIYNLNKQLYQMELKEIKQVLQILLQYGQMQEVIQKQLWVYIEDKQYHDQIIELFNQLQTKLLETQLQISNFQKINYNFSDNLKHGFIQLSDIKKIFKAQCDKANYIVCLCDFPIPQHGSFTIDFKNNQLGLIMIGICKCNSIKKDFTFDNYSSIGHGFYCLSQDGYVYSHHEITKNNKYLGIKFGQFDIINVEVNQQTKQIIWRNEAKRQKYVELKLYQQSLEFEPSEDLYFCCVMYRLWYQKEFNFEVEII